MQTAKAYLATQFGSWFLKKKYHKVLVSLLRTHAAKVSTWHTKKLCTRISNSFSLSYGLVVFIDMNTYILTKSWNFKTFLKENYAITLDSCYLFAKKMLNIKLNMMFMVLMEFAYIRHSWPLQQIRWIPYNLSRWWIWQSVSLKCKVFLYLIMEEANLLQALMAPGYWEALK